MQCGTPICAAILSSRVQSTMKDIPASHHAPRKYARHMCLYLQNFIPGLKILLIPRIPCHSVVRTVITCSESLGKPSRFGSDVTHGDSDALIWGARLNMVL
jgi:hypothetical protein